MNKLLVALCMVITGFATYSNAALSVVVSEGVFDEIVARLVVSDHHVTIIIDERKASTNYITYHDGFYYTLKKSGARKIFFGPNINVIPGTVALEESLAPFF